MAEIYVSASIEALVGKLMSLDLNKFGRRGRVHAAIKEWERMLVREIRAVLYDAEEKQRANWAVKIWLIELRDFAYDMEDILDNIATEAFRRNLMVESQASTSKSRNLIYTWITNFKLRADRMVAQTKQITNRLQDIVKQKIHLELRGNILFTTSLPYETRYRFPTTSLVDETSVYGRENDKDAILKLLFSPDDKVSVIPVVGMGGLGKTTLAQLVYNDDRVKGYFDLRGWVCVSDEFDVVRITKDLVEYVSISATSGVYDLNSLQVRLKDALFQKKFLFVLDDVWNKNYEDWFVLRKPLEFGAPGSRIIVTTRDQDVAAMMGTVPSFNLNVLSNDDCLTLFTLHALGTRDFNAHPAFKNAGEEIVRKCNGLPLAVKTLGGLLRCTLDIDEWIDVLNSNIWDLPETGHGIFAALQLSYYYLPSHLKSCFAYCSILPKDYEFEEEELVLLWMAEGLVLQHGGEEKMEAIGSKCFHDLLSRSFFQLSSVNNSLFVMHDLINDLAQWAAGEICFKLEDDKRCKIPKKARHSSYVGSYRDGLKKFEAFDEVGSLRTFLPLKTPVGSYLSNGIPLALLPKFKCLRVLSLSGYYITELPNSIGSLKQLRYLDLSHTKIRSLPESTSTLCNLQTLILKNCSCLKKLPTNTMNLINLRHLDLSYVNSIEGMPPRVGKLTNLQNLSNFIVGNNSASGIIELTNLNCLRGTLCISRMENVIDAQDARKANLNNKKDLDVLIIQWSSKLNEFGGGGGVETGVLNMLRPHKKLRELIIESYGGVGFPTWVGHSSFSIMVCIRLENCVNCTSLPPLGQLPLLKHLCIKRMHSVNIVGLEFIGKGCPRPFPSLETLSFDNMEEWEEWIPHEVNEQVEVFPCLRELSVTNCPKLLGRLPEHLPSLEKFVIHDCEQLAISISSLPNLFKLSIRKCQKVVWGNTVCLNSLNYMVFCDIANLMCLTEGFMQGLTKVENFEIAGCKELTSLCQNDARLLQHLTSLRRLKIKGCPRFVSLVAEEVEEKQLGVPWRLESLEFCGCDNLQKLQGLHSLTSLSELTIKGCPGLVSFPETGLPPMLRQLMIERCNSLKSLPQTMMLRNNYASLEHLSIDRCDSLTFIARGQLPSRLKKLQIECCNNLHSLFDEECSTSSSSPLTMRKNNNSNASILEHFHIYRCPSLTSLSSSGELSTTLKRFYIASCRKLKSLVKTLHNAIFLERIEVCDCDSLEFLPDGLHNLHHLSYISIKGCPSLVSFPSGGLPATNLRELWISDCEKLTALPDHMHNLTSLLQLGITDCPSIISFPEMGFPTNLTTVEIRDFKVCEPLFEWGLHRLTSLQRLSIEGPCPDMVSFPKEEEGMMLSTSLTKLMIKEFPNLKYLSSKVFKNLTSLEYLFISDCPKLASFPKEGLPPSLLELCIYRCPRLKKQCKKDRGQYWPIVAHIPYVRIDNRLIYEYEESK